MAPKRNIFGLSRGRKDSSSSNPHINVNLGRGTTMFINPSTNPSIDPNYNQINEHVNLDDDDEVEISLEQIRSQKNKSHEGSTSQTQSQAIPPTPTSQISSSNVVERKKTSWVWKYFVANKNDQTAKCTECAHVLVYKTGDKNSGTGHLMRHLRNIHMIGDATSEGGGVQTTIDMKTGKHFMFSRDTYKVETMKFAIGSALPFGFADGWRFRNWISKVVNPQAFRFPRTTMRSLSFKYFKHEQEVIGCLVSSLPWSVCLTSDISSFKEFDIMCVTLHWIDMDWVLQMRIIYFRSIAKHNAILVVYVL